MSCAQSLQTERSQGSRVLWGAAGCRGWRRGAPLTGGAQGSEGWPCGRHPGSRHRRGPAPAHILHSCGTGCSWQRAPEPRPCRWLHRPGPAGGETAGSAVAPELCSGLSSCAAQPSPAPMQAEPTASPPSSPAVPMPGSCLVLIQQQLQHRLPNREEADLLDDVHPMVHPHGLVQPPIICKHQSCAEQGLGHARHQRLPHSSRRPHSPVPRNSTS